MGLGRALGEESKVVWPALLISRSIWPTSAVILSTARWRSEWEVVLPWIAMRLPCSWAYWSEIIVLMLSMSGVANGGLDGLLESFFVTACNIDFCSVAFEGLGDD